jgi:hypothetical protein
LELTGESGGRWTLGTADPVAVVRTETLDYLWHLSGRDGQSAVDIDGDLAVATAVLNARVEF